MYPNHDSITEHVFDRAEAVTAGLADDEEEDLDCSDDYELVIELSDSGTSYTFEQTARMFDGSRDRDDDDPYLDCGDGD